VANGMPEFIGEKRNAADFVTRRGERANMYAGIGIILAFIGVLWTIFSVQTKAEQAFEYTNKNQELPHRVSSVEHKVENLENTPVQFEEIKGNFKVLMTQMTNVMTQMTTLDKNIKERVETLSETITSHVMLDRFKGLPPEVPVMPGTRR